MWKIVQDNDNYRINSDGQVLNVRNNKILKPYFGTNGYHYVKIRINNKLRHVAVHRLVANAFILNPNNYSDVNHKNGIKTDNRVENLEWVNRSQNCQHAWDIGLNDHNRERFRKMAKNNCGEQSPASKLTKEDVLKIKEMANNGIRVEVIKQEFQISTAHVYRLINGERWGHLK